MINKDSFTLSKPIPLALQRKVRIINASGGVNHDSLPVRENGINSGELSAMLPNNTVVIVVDTRKDPVLIKQYYDSIPGWGMFQTLDGQLFTPSGTGQNWCEYKSHLEDVIEPEPPEPVDEYETKEVAGI